MKRHVFLLRVSIMGVERVRINLFEQEDNVCISIALTLDAKVM